MIELSELSSADLKELAVHACHETLEELKKKRPKERKSSWSYTRDGYEYTKRLENLATMGFFCYDSLCDYDQTVEYFRSHYPKRDPAIELNVLLSLLRDQNRPQQWVRVYEEAVKRGLQPRKQLREGYEKIRSQYSEAVDSPAR